MGLFSVGKKLFKRAVKKAKPFIPAAAGAIGGAGAAEIATQVLRGGGPAGLPELGRPMSGLPAVRGLPGQFPTPARLTRAVAPGAVRVGDVFSMGGCPAGFHPAKDGSGRCVRNRRMNVMNPRAARRAIRRIKGARKMLQSIERQLPKQRSRSRVSGHRARLTHT